MVCVCLVQAFAQETLLRPLARTVMPTVQRHLPRVFGLLQAIVVTTSPSGETTLAPSAVKGFKCAMVCYLRRVVVLD